MPSVNAVNHKSSCPVSVVAALGHVRHRITFLGGVFPTQPFRKFSHFLWLVLDLSQLSVGQVEDEVFYAAL